MTATPGHFRRATPEGGAGACSILASTDRPVRSNRAGGATSAFLKCDRRDLPEADERNGDDPALRQRRRRLVLSHVRSSGGWLLLTRGAIILAGAA